MSRLPVRYRLYHLAENKYVPWPGGRGFKAGLYDDVNISRIDNDTVKLAMLANLDWGGTRSCPVLEIHMLDRDNQLQLKSPIHNGWGTLNGVTEDWL